MGDIRFRDVYEHFAQAPDRMQALNGLSDAEVISALAGAAEAADPLLVNVLATEALNRQVRARARGAALALGVVAAAILTVGLLTIYAVIPYNREDDVTLVTVLVAFAVSLALGYWRWRRPPEIGA